MTVFMLLLSRLVGWWSALAGVVTTVMVLPVSAWVGSRQSASRERLIALTDARVKLCSEAVSGGIHLPHCNTVMYTHASAFSSTQAFSQKRVGWWSLQLLPWAGDGAMTS
jgi:hypothetical protein